MTMVMPYRKVATLWVPLVEWNEAQGWSSMDICKRQGMTKEQAMRVINANRKLMPPGTRYCMVPIDRYRNESDPTL